MDKLKDRIEKAVRLALMDSIINRPAGLGLEHADVASGDTLRVSGRIDLDQLATDVADSAMGAFFSEPAREADGGVRDGRGNSIEVGDIVAVPQCGIDGAPYLTFEIVTGFHHNDVVGHVVHFHSSRVSTGQESARADGVVVVEKAGA